MVYDKYYENVFKLATVPLEIDIVIS